MSIDNKIIVLSYSFINVLIFYVLNYIRSNDILIYVGLAGIVIHLYLIYLVFKNKVDILDFFSKKLLVVYPLFSFLSYIPVLQKYKDAHYYLLILLLLIWVCDTSAYLTGRKFGKRKLFERVSPKKTWEGFTGSLCFTPLISILIPIIFSNNLVLPTSFRWVLMGLMVAIFGTLGDLYQSQIKRIYGVKDSGTIMPGHGGIWDRFDSFIFLLPFYSWILYLTMTK